LSSIGGGSDKSFVGCGNLLDILVLNPVDFVFSSFIKARLSGFFRVLWHQFLGLWIMDLQHWEHLDG